MTGDDELARAALGQLVMILATSVRTDSQIETLVTAAGLAGKVSLKGDARAQWTSIVDFAADRPAVFDELLKLIDQHLKGTRYCDDFLKWRKQNSWNGHTILDQAISDVRKSRSTLLTINDPRKGQLYLRTIRSSIIEIKDIMEAAPERVSNTSLVAAEEVAVARNEILLPAGLRSEKWISF